MRRGEEVKTGDELEPLEIEVTRTLIVAGAIASRDYQDVHHDAELAREKGAPDIFMNILTTNGLVGRYVTDRLGPSAVLRKVAIRLGAPNYPGDTMVLRGTVTAVGDDGTAEVSITGTNRLGRHVTGAVTATIGGRATPTAGVPATGAPAAGTGTTDAPATGSGTTGAPATGSRTTDAPATGTRTAGAPAVGPPTTGGRPSAPEGAA